MPFEPLTSPTLEDPFPAYRELREAGGVTWHDGLQSWIVASAAAYEEVVRDPDTYISDWRKVGIPTPGPALSIQSLDPPDHTAVRRVLLESFRSVRLDDTRRAAARAVATRLAARDAGVAFDLVREVTAPVALDAITGFLGVEAPDHEQFSEVSDAIVTSMDSGLVPGSAAEGTNARATVNAMIERWLDSPPHTGVVATLTTSEAAQRLPRSLVVNSVRAVLQAGYQSWGRFLGIAALHLLQRPGIRAHVVANGNWTQLVNELLRFESSVQADSRAAARDVSLAGARIVRGDILILLHGAIDHDPQRYADPDALRPHRDAGTHSAFGRGIHACPGASFVQTLSPAVLAAIFTPGSTLELAARPRWRRNASIRGLASLPVRLIRPYRPTAARAPS